MIRLPDEYRQLEPELDYWAQWYRGLGVRLLYPAVNILYRMERQLRAGATHRRDVTVPIETFLPDDAQAIDRAIKQLGKEQLEWQNVVVYEWVYHMSQHRMAKRMRVGKNAVPVLRRHAYGRLAELLAVDTVPVATTGTDGIKLAHICIA